MRFYDPSTGKRVDSIPTKDGKKTKAPNINDAIALGLVPSVTEVINVVSKPFLLSWLQVQAFNSAWDSAQTPIPKEEAWKLYEQQSAMARDKGSDIHDKISRLEETPLTKPTIDWLKSKYTSLEHEVMFATRLYGGTIDLIGTLDTGQVDVLDVKSVGKKRDPYDSEAQQIVAYRNYIKQSRNINVRACINIYISQETGEILNIHDWETSDLIRAEDTFYAIHNLWQRLNGYDIKAGRKFYE